MNTYNVVVSITTTVCLDAKNGDDAIDKGNQRLSQGDKALKTKLWDNFKKVLDEGCVEATDPILVN